MSRSIYAIWIKVAGTGDFLVTEFQHFSYVCGNHGSDVRNTDVPHYRSLLYRLDKCRVDGSYPWKSSIIDTTLSKLQSLIPLFHWQTRMSTNFTCTVTPCGVCPNTGEHSAAGICTYEIPIRTPIYDYKIPLLQKALNVLLENVLTGSILLICRDFLYMTPYWKPLLLSVLLLKWELILCKKIFRSFIRHSQVKH